MKKNVVFKIYRKDVKFIDVRMFLRNYIERIVKYFKRFFVGLFFCFIG